MMHTFSHVELYYLHCGGLSRERNFAGPLYMIETWKLLAYDPEESYERDKILGKKERNRDGLL